MPLRSIRRLTSRPGEVDERGRTGAGHVQHVHNVRESSVRLIRQDHRPDPTDGITLPRKRRARCDDDFLTEDISKIMAAADVRFRPFIGLCAFAGLRLVRLRRSRSMTSLSGRTLTVSRQVQRAVRTGRNRFQSTVRTCRLSGRGLVTCGRPCRGRVSAEGWLFVGANDGPPHRIRSATGGAKTLRDAGCKDIKLHDLATSTRAG